MACSPCSPIALPLNSPDTPELVKIVLLGAPGVGKTSIIQVCFTNYPKYFIIKSSFMHSPNTKNNAYYVSRDSTNQSSRLKRLKLDTMLRISKRVYGLSQQILDITLILCVLCRLSVSFRCRGNTYSKYYIYGSMRSQVNDLQLVAFFIMMVRQ